MLFNSLNLIKTKLPSNWKLYCIGRDDGIKKNLLSLSKKFKIYNRIKCIETINVEKILYNCEPESCFSLVSFNCIYIFIFYRLI